MIDINLIDESKLVFHHLETNEYPMTAYFTYALTSEEIKDFCDKIEFDQPVIITEIAFCLSIYDDHDFQLDALCTDHNENMWLCASAYHMETATKFLDVIPKSEMIDYRRNEQNLRKEIVNKVKKYLDFDNPCLFACSKKEVFDAIRRYEDNSNPCRLNFKLTKELKDRIYLFYNHNNLKHVDKLKEKFSEFVGPVLPIIARIKISRDERKQIDDLLSLTGDEIYQKYGYKRDETITHTAKFTNGLEADIRLVICDDDSPYTEGILYEDGSQVELTDPGDTYMGTWEFEYNDQSYQIIVEEDKTLENEKPENSCKLSERVFNCMSDGYDDEEYRNETIEKLQTALESSDSNILQSAFENLCERIEEFEMD